MAIYHLSAKVISRGKGQSAIAAAAYRSGERLFDEQAGEQKSYTTRAKRILFTDIMAPKDAPEWVHDRNRLWNQAERAEKRKDAQLAREIEVSLPHELTPQQREYLVKDFAREAFVRRGYAVDIAIHAPDRGSDDRNHHAHLMVTRRTLGPEGFAATKDWQFDPKQLDGWREQWANLANRHLERHGHAARIDHRSLEDQGADREPTTHLGYAASEMAARGAQSDRMDVMLDILERNELRFELALVDEDLARLHALNDNEQQTAMSRRPWGSGMEPEPPTDQQLQGQAERELQALRELQRQEEQARAAIELQRHKEVQARAEAFQRAADQDADEARKKKTEHEAAEARRAQEGDISSASARYAIALGDTYEVRDPYASLARAAMRESSLFHQNQERMRVEMAKEPDPDKRRIIELRKTIEGCEYMAITNDRLAGIGVAITGRSDNVQSALDKDNAASYRAMAVSLRAERNAAIEAVQAKEKQAQALPEGRQAPAARSPEPPSQAAAPAPAPAREAAVDPARQAGDGREARQFLRHDDLKAQQAAEPGPIAPAAPPPARNGAIHQPVADRVAAPEPTRKAEVTGTWRPGQTRIPQELARTGEPPPREPGCSADANTVEPAQPAAPSAAPQSATPNQPDIRVDDGSQRPVPLADFVRDNPRAEAEPRRPISMRAIATDPQAKKESQLARFKEVRQSQDADKALGRIGKDLEKGNQVRGEDVKSLTREQWERVTRHGSNGLREMAKEHQRAQSHGRGGGRTPDA